eukprot:4488259-Ditylum_brightwellii.AAC.1
MPRQIERDKTNPPAMLSLLGAAAKPPSSQETCSQRLLRRNEKLKKTERKNYILGMLDEFPYKMPWNN